MFDPSIERAENQRRLVTGQINRKIADPITVTEILKVMAQSAPGPDRDALKDLRKKSHGLIVAGLNGIVFHGLAPEEFPISRTTLIPGQIQEHLEITDQYL